MPNKNIRDLLREVPITNKSYPEYIEALAEHLEASGVLLPPVSVGQIVYSALSPIWDMEEPFIEAWVVNEIDYENGKWYAINKDGEPLEVGSEWCKLTREEAEQALKGAENVEKD